MWAQLLAAGPLLLVVFGALAVTIFVTLSVSDAVRLRGRLRTDALLATLMRATGSRRDRAETFDVALALLCRELQARSGLIVSAPTPDRAFALVASETITRLDAVLQIPADDAVIAAALAVAPAPQVLPVPSNSRWNALSGGRAEWLVAVAFGTPTDRGVLVLNWEQRGQAARHRAALAQSGSYLSQVVSDYAGLERRAREIQRLNAALRDQELLVRTAAHDLGNALVEPSVFVAGLEGRVAVETEPARASAEHKLEIIGSMLADLVDPGRDVDREAVPAEELVQLAVPLYAALRPAGPPLVLEVPPALPVLWIDRVAVLRVLANLLTNAVVHNADQPDLRVRLRLRAEDEAFTLSVADNGRGIAPEDQARIFEFGVRVDPDGRTRGHGLGLSSSRRLIAAHGGTLTVHSALGEGACFTVRLPQSSADA